MAGQKIITRESTMEDGLGCAGYPVVEIIENGNVEDGDEWAFFRMTEEGARAYHEIGCEIAAGIMGLTINGKRAVEGEITRFKTKGEAKEAWDKLTEEEQRRILVRTVRPKPSGS